MSRFTSRITPAALDEREIASLKLAILDYLACAMTGAREPVALLALDLAVSQCGSTGPVAVLGHSVRTSATAAALVNGTIAHACDFDDLSEPMCGHPTAPVLPAVWRSPTSGADRVLMCWSRWPPRTKS
jgi:2-methylcitrate dehydratase PrpD